jgi:hypothetical protein
VWALPLRKSVFSAGAVVMLPEQLDGGDLYWVECRRDIRIIISLPGRYSLADRRDVQGERRQFACRAINISNHAIGLAAPVNGKLGERVIADIDRLGRLQGNVARLLERGFVMSIAASDEERAALVDKIEWLEKHKNLEVPDGRTHKRFMPENPYSTLALHDGTIMTCFVIDISVSGAAVSADTVPAIGTVLAVGKAIGRVVRHFAGGFAVKFVDLHKPDSLEALVMGYSSDKSVKRAP